MAVSTHSPLVNRMVARQWLTVSEADTLSTSGLASTNTPLSLLRQLWQVDEHQLAQKLAQLADCRYWSTNQLPSNESFQRWHREPLLRQYHMVPYQDQHQQWWLLTTDPSHEQARQEFQFKLGHRLQFVVIAEVDMHHLLATLSTTEPPSPQGNIPRQPTDELHRLLTKTLAQDISDIHIEMDQYWSRVRIRIDGLLQEWQQIAHRQAEQWIAQLKVQAELDITERRQPQDGHLTFNTQHRDVHFRVSTLPTLWGEKLVLRVLDQQTTPLSLPQLGLGDDQLSLFYQALHQQQGLILVTGPTGSGKTATLYSALNYLNTPQRNISSAEDPIEMALPGINQAAIHPQQGLTFARLLRAFLRQDPDILMLGEIRDEETADIAVKAAQTGHLVLSTLHTRSAASSLQRLQNMGIAAHNIVNAVSLVIAQRLLRKLCPHCKRPNNPSVPHSDLVAVGCPHCHQGYKGRIGVFELLPMTPALAEQLLQMTQVAHAAGPAAHQTLTQAAAILVTQGMTSVAEVARVLGNQCPTTTP